MCDQKPQNCAEVFTFFFCFATQDHSIMVFKLKPSTKLKITQNYMKIMYRNIFMLIKLVISVPFAVATNTIAASVYFTMQLSVYLNSE